MKAHLVVCAVAASFGITATGFTQPWPSRQITIVVPFSAGGPLTRWRG